MLSHLPMAVFYGLLVVIVKASWWPLSMELLNWLWWILGVVVGVLILFLDRIVYTYSYPQEQLSYTFVHHMKEKRYLRGLEMLDSRRVDQNRLTFRSAIFMVIWIPLSFFALTSTAGLFGKGVVMGIMLHILSDAWKLQRVDRARLNERLFWQIGRRFSQEEQVTFLIIMSSLFGLFSFWVR